MGARQEVVNDLAILHNRLIRVGDSGRGADEIGGGRGGELPRQIGGEYKGALQHDDEAEGPAAVIGIDPAGERGDPGADAPLGNQQQEALGIVRHGLVGHGLVRHGLVRHGLVRDCPVRICALTLSRGAGGAWARNIASASLAVRDNGGVAARSAEPPLARARRVPLPYPSCRRRVKQHTYRSNISRLHCESEIDRCFNRRGHRLRSTIEQRLAGKNVVPTRERGIEFDAAARTDTETDTGLHTGTDAEADVADGEGGVDRAGCRRVRSQARSRRFDDPRGACRNGRGARSPGCRQDVARDGRCRGVPVAEREIRGRPDPAGGAAIRHRARREHVPPMTRRRPRRAREAMPRAIRTPCRSMRCDRSVTRRS